MNCPAAVPSVPVPSMMPVTVDIAFVFPLRADYLPRSAEQAADIMLFSPLMKKPMKNISMKKTPLGML